MVVAGDFNAKARTWGSAVDDARGAVLGEFAASLGLWAENVGSVPTFAAGERFSVVDVTFARLPRRSAVCG